MDVGVVISNVYLFPLVVGGLEVGGRTKLLYVSVRYFVGKCGAGRKCFRGGGVGEVMSTDIILFWGEVLDLERRPSWVCTPNIFSA